VRQFTPNWFTVTMGTGILALALNHQAPFATPALHRIAEASWFCNTGLFTAFTAFYAARWMLFPHEASPVGTNVQRLYSGMNACSPNENGKRSVIPQVSRRSFWTTS
jgi:Voltage-dependent anion channel